jgi:asparagine synthase (glutamine-hydrolysing)
MTEQKIGIKPEGRIKFLEWGFLQSRNTIWAVMGARVGLNLAHPLLDRRVVNFALSLPLERMVHGGHSRQPFRDAMEGILPDCVRFARVKGDSLPTSTTAMLAAKPALLAAAAALRQMPVAAVFDVAAIEQALIALPDAPEHLGRACRRQAITALRAISLANHLARMS